MADTPERTRLGVLGWPVAHSRSPQMHSAAFRALRMKDWRYQRLPVPTELFEETTRSLWQAGFLGANVTIPHKEAALALADSASLAAREIGAANTLSFGEDGEIAAENTDAAGLIAALGQLDLPGRTALVLGAGGSARAAVWALIRAGADVSVWNRTFSRAEQLASGLGAVAVPSAVSADLLVNCTSVGLAQPADVIFEDGRSHPIPVSASEDAQLNQLGLSADEVGRYPYVVDLVYSDAETALLAAARRSGAQTVDGVEMLVRQGSLSFKLWTGVDPPLDVMRAAAAQPLE